MKQTDYAERWHELHTERTLLWDQRTTLETELSEISTRIAHLTEVLNHLAPLAGVPIGEDVSGLGITDATRHILVHSSVPLSAAEVREALVSKGFDFSGHSAPMSSIYKILGRLTEDNSTQIERVKGEGGRVHYFYKAPEIKDEDIPF